MVGSAAIDRRIALRATFMPATAYEVTEVGLYGSVPGGATTLYGYWSDSGTAVAQTAPGTSTVIAATLDFVAAAADVAVTVDASIQLGGDVIPATTARRGAVELATTAEGRTDDAERAVTPLVMGIVVDEKIASATQAVASADGLAAAVRSQGLLEEAQMQLSGRLTTVEGDTRSATTGRSGIVELATDAEAKAGMDAERAVTPETMRAAASSTLASLLGAIPEDGTKYALQGGVNGVLTLVSLAIVALAVGGTAEVTPTEGWGDDVTIDGQSSWTIPAAGNYTLLFAIHKTNGTPGGLFWRRPVGGVAAEMADQGYSASGGHRGAIWCGALSQGDVITVRYAWLSTGAPFRFRYSTSASLGSYDCPVLAILRQEST